MPKEIKSDEYKYGSIFASKNALGKALQRFFPECAIDKRLIEISNNTQLDAQSFYEDFGFMEHQKTRQLVKHLTKYQKMIWNQAYKYKYRLTVKSQKVGLTTTTLMEDFQLCILPPENKWSCMGKEILVIAQTLNHAKEHLRTLRRMILQSSRYRDFLITTPTEIVLKDETTKVSVLYIKNPYNPLKPTRIIGLGPKESGIWSWKEVKHIHMSDVAAINQIDDSGSFGAAMSRLANTAGSIHIETPPRGQRGKVWELYKTFAGKDISKDEGVFHVEEIKVEHAVKAGVISREFLDGEKSRNPRLYNQLYECEFMNPYTSWYTEDMFKYSKELAEGFVA
jgi:hypothetical protein